MYTTYGHVSTAYHIITPESKPQFIRQYYIIIFYDISYKYSVFCSFFSLTLPPIFNHLCTTSRRFFFTIKSNFDTVRVSDNDKKNCVFFYVQCPPSRVRATYTHAHACIQTMEYNFLFNTFRSISIIG